MTITQLQRVSLVRGFFATFSSVREGLEYLNAELGTNYQHGHKSRWERGEREPDRNARAVMLHRVLPGVLRDHKNATAEDVAAALDRLL